jgi:hypothetical protein
MRWRNYVRDKASVIMRQPQGFTAVLSKWTESVGQRIFLHRWAAILVYTKFNQKKKIPLAKSY